MARSLYFAAWAVMFWTLVALSVTKCVGWQITNTVTGASAPKE